ncbi:hypothetical protein ANO11243_080960 [Dothideomycetidae sp. 11243]|nr:hypothetical protein ANO11243_080960 [fungal sp. No.11243]
MMCGGGGDEGMVVWGKRCKGGSDTGTAGSRTVAGIAPSSSGRRAAGTGCSRKCAVVKGDSEERKARGRTRTRQDPGQAKDLVGKEHARTTRRGRSDYAWPIARCWLTRSDHRPSCSLPITCSAALRPEPEGMGGPAVFQHACPMVHGQGQRNSRMSTITRADCATPPTRQRCRSSFVVLWVSVFPGYSKTLCPIADGPPVSGLSGQSAIPRAQQAQLDLVRRRPRRSVLDSARWALPATRRPLPTARCPLARSLVASPHDLSFARVPSASTRVAVANVPVVAIAVTTTSTSTPCAAPSSIAVAIITGSAAVAETPLSRAIARPQSPPS